MKKLEFPFHTKGFRHDLLKRDGLVCLVRRSRPHHWHYEVVKLTISAPQVVFGKYYPVREVYPATSEWGQYGFTYLCTDLSNAEKRYHTLFAIKKVL